MFEMFSDRARRAVVRTQEEARLLHHGYLGTEHLLLGLIQADSGAAARVLSTLDISLEAAREQVIEITGRGPAMPSGYIPFTPRAKNALERSLPEAQALNHAYVGTGHVLLGLIHEDTGVGARVLIRLGAELEPVREQVLLVLQNASHS